ncbi:MAG TPA: Clp protease N-terminal domain-containing protein [Trebonia sp.]
MFERFSAGSRRVVILAQEEARMQRHQHVGSEHLLLGLIHEEAGVAAALLGAAGVTLEAARTAVTEIAGPGDKPRAGHLPFTPRSKTILELSLREALELRQNYIRPEHLLLGLIREKEGVGALVLARLAGPLPALRERVLTAARDIPSEPAGEEEADAWSSPASFPRSARSQFPSQGDLGAVLRSVDRRLAGIERHLGLPSGEDSGPDEPGEPPAAAP